MKRRWKGPATCALVLGLWAIQSRTAAAGEIYVKSGLLQGIGTVAAIAQAPNHGTIRDASKRWNVDLMTAGRAIKPLVTDLFRDLRSRTCRPAPRALGPPRDASRGEPAVALCW